MISVSSRLQQFEVKDWRKSRNIAAPSSPSTVDAPSESEAREGGTLLPLRLGETKGNSLPPASSHARSTTSLHPPPLLFHEIREAFLQLSCVPSPSLPFPSVPATRQQPVTPYP